jgi:hypothetical protein
MESGWQKVEKVESNCLPSLKIYTSEGNHCYTAMFENKENFIFVTKYVFSHLDQMIAVQSFF